MKELKQGTFKMEFSLNNVDYLISLSTSKSEENGLSAEKYKAELKAGPKKVFLEKIHRDDGNVDYNIRGEGPGMDDEAERKRFLRTWAMVVFGQLQRHANEMNGTDQDDQFKRSMTSFLQLYKHFFEPRLLSLLVQDAETDNLSSDSGLDENDNDATETDESSSDSGIDENGPTLNSDARAHGRDDADDSSTSSDNDDDNNETSYPGDWFPRTKVTFDDVITLLFIVYYSGVLVNLKNVDSKPRWEQI